jgi:hypothetical protein
MGIGGVDRYASPLYKVLAASILRSYLKTGWRISPVTVMVKFFVIRTPAQQEYDDT